MTWTAPDGRTYDTTPRPHVLLENLQLTQALDPTLGREWLPGLPPGMSLAELAVAEASQPESPPHDAAVRQTPPDWADLNGADPDWADLDWADLDWAEVDEAELDRARQVASNPASAQRDAFAHEFSPLEEWFAEQLALAA